jgi:hypothetical protein
MQIWFGFYAMTGAAAATLMGLLFVAVSLNSAAILNEEHGHARRLAEQAFQNYVTVLSVSLFALFPSLSLPQFSLVTLMVTGTSGVWVLIRLYEFLTKLHGTTRMKSLRRQMFSLVGFGMLMYATGSMAVNWGDWRNLLAAAVVVLLLAATRVSWMLLIFDGY